MRLLFISFIALFIVSCTSQFINEPNSSQSDQISEASGVLTPQDAKNKAVRAFINAFCDPEKANQTIDLSVRCTIEKTSASLSRSSDSQFYIVNFDQGGFVVLPASASDDRIIGMSDTGQFTYDADDPNDIGNYILALASNFEPAPSPTLPDSSLITPVRRSVTYTDTIVINNHQVKRDSTVYFQSSAINGLIKTQWSELYPYNYYCYTTDSLWATTGCVAKATSQLCAYHRKPDSFNGHDYNYDLILTSKCDTELTPGALAAAELIHDIGVAINTHYVHDNASTAYTKDAIQLMGTFGYSDIKRLSYDYDSVMVQIKEKLPIYMMGYPLVDDQLASGHAWIIDGYYLETAVVKYTYLDDNVIQIKLEEPVAKMVHCNWGWGGVDDGLYYSGMFNTPSYDDYSYNKIMYINIK